MDDLENCIIADGPYNNSGYAFVRSKEYGLVPAHRYVMLQLLGKEALEGKVIMHICDNPKCINERHLSVGTQSDNIKDGIAKNRVTQGKPFGWRKISQEDINTMKQLYREGVHYKDLATMFDVGNSTVHRYLSRG